MDCRRAQAKPPAHKQDAGEESERSDGRKRRQYKNHFYWQEGNDFFKILMNGRSIQRFKLTSRRRWMMMMMTETPGGWRGWGAFFGSTPVDVWADRFCLSREGWVIPDKAVISASCSLMLWNTLRILLFLLPLPRVNQTIFPWTHRAGHGITGVT